MLESRGSQDSSPLPGVDVRPEERAVLPDRAQQSLPPTMQPGNAALAARAAGDGPGQRPWNVALRRSTNEAIPSAKSAEFAVLARMAGISRYAACSPSSR